jgi:hypothetical protein
MTAKVLDLHSQGKDVYFVDERIAVVMDNQAGGSCIYLASGAVIVVDETPAVVVGMLEGKASSKTKDLDPLIKKETAKNG